MLDPALDKTLTLFLHISGGGGNRREGTDQGVGSTTILSSEVLNPTKIPLISLIMNTQENSDYE